MTGYMAFPQGYNKHLAVAGAIEECVSGRIYPTRSVVHIFHQPLIRIQSQICQVSKRIRLSYAFHFTRLQFYQITTCNFLQRPGAGWPGRRTITSPFTRSAQGRLTMFPSLMVGCKVMLGDCGL